MHGQVKRQDKVRIPRQISNLQVETDDENVPGHPYDQPGRVPCDISGPELNGAKQAEDDHDDVEEVGEDGSPLVAQEINHLTLQHTDQLHATYEGQGASATTAPHGVLRLPCCDPRGEELKLLLKTPKTCSWTLEILEDPPGEPVWLAGSPGGAALRSASESKDQPLYSLKLGEMKGSNFIQKETGGNVILRISIKQEVRDQRWMVAV